MRKTRRQYIKKVLHIRAGKREHDLREMRNALLYSVKTGCQWRMLPCRFPEGQSVYRYCRKRAEQTDFDLPLNELREEARLKRGQNRQAGAGIMDSRSVRWGNNRSLNGIDGSRKVKGIKRHAIADRNGFLVAVTATAANICRGKVACLPMRMLKELCSFVKLILAGGGYGGEIMETLKNIIRVAVGNYKGQVFRPKSQV